MIRIDQLISDYLDGRLDPADAKELADHLDQDKVLRDDFIELYRQHCLLSGQYVTTSESDFVQRVLADLRVENRSSVPGVVSDLGQQGQRADTKERGSRVERSVRDRRSESQGFWARLFRPSPAGWAAAAVAGVLLIFAGCFLFLRSGSFSAEVTKASVGVRVARGDRSLTCYEGFQLRIGDVVQTPTNGTAVIQYLGEPTTLALRPGTQLRFLNPKHGKRLILESGEIAVVAGHQPTNAPMVLETQQAEARVVGTRFQLAARHFSTWLEVSEGGVAFQRNSSQGSGLAGSNSQPGPNQILVKTGEYAVVADGIPLETYAVTDQLNLDKPLPIKIGWFNYYGEPNWYVHPPQVQQIEPTSISRTFQLPAIKGSILVSGMATVNWVKRGSALADEGVGFGIGLSAGSDYFMACVRQKDGQRTLELVDLDQVPLYKGQPILELAGHDMVSLAEVPLPPALWPTCKIKFALERGNSQEAVLRAKVWSGNAEPQEWQLSTTVQLHGLSDVFELRLATMNSACTFEDTSAFLIE
jgi:hypothetical protein